jgi:hypothetical protein
MARQVEQRCLNLVTGPADRQRPLGDLVEGRLEVKLAIKDTIWIGEGQRDGFSWPWLSLER